MGRTAILLNDNLPTINFRGMKRYFHELSVGIAAKFGQQLLVYSPDKPDLQDANYIKALCVGGQQPLRLNQVAVSALALLTQPDVVFSIYYNDVATRARQVFTVYDMIPERLPHYYDRNHSGNRKFIAQKQRCMARADLILSISQNTARDLVECYPALASKPIVVAPLGVDEFFLQTPAHFEQKSARPYFLYVGHRRNHKNFRRLLDAFARCEFRRAIELRVVSPDAFAADELELIQSLGLQETVHIELAIDDDALRTHYAGAVALIYPSEYEGFGLPILEAMACGTLVATAACSSMPEVGGDVAFYFDPLDPDAMADVLTHVASVEPAHRQERIARGRTRAEAFSWDACRRRTIEAIMTLTGQP